MVDRTGYTYDVFGRRGTQTRATGAEAYGYDPVGRLASIARRLKAAGEQIASAEAPALKDVKDRAVQVAIAAAARAM